MEVAAFVVGCVALLLSLFHAAWQVGTWRHAHGFNVQVPIKPEWVVVASGKYEITVVVENRGATSEAVQEIARLRRACEGVWGGGDAARSSQPARSKCCRVRASAPARGAQDLRPTRHGVRTIPERDHGVRDVAKRWADRVAALPDRSAITRSELVRQLLREASPMPPPSPSVDELLAAV